MVRKHREIGKAGWGYTATTSIIGFIYFFPVLWIILSAGHSTKAVFHADSG